MTRRGLSLPCSRYLLPSACLHTAVHSPPSTNAIYNRILLVSNRFDDCTANFAGAFFLCLKAFDGKKDLPRAVGSNFLGVSFGTMSSAVLHCMLPLNIYHCFSPPESMGPPGTLGFGRERGEGVSERASERASE